MNQADCVVCRSGENPASGEVGLKDEEKVLAEALRAEFSWLHPRPLRPQEPLSPASPEIQPQPVPDPAAAQTQLVPVCDDEPLLASQVATNCDEGDLCSMTSQAADLGSGDKGKSSSQESPNYKE